MNDGSSEMTEPSLGLREVDEKAIRAFAAAMPDAFVQNSVGTRYVL
jgi:hypothetical protein